MKVYAALMTVEMKLAVENIVFHAYTWSNYIANCSVTEISNVHYFVCNKQAMLVVIVFADNCQIIYQHW